MVRVTKMLDEANTKLQEREQQVEKARQTTESVEEELRQVCIDESIVKSTFADARNGGATRGTRERGGT